VQFRIKLIRGATFTSKGHEDTRDTWVKLIEQDRWAKMVELDKIGASHALCYVCKIFHPKAAFTETMLDAAREDRICIGSTFALPVCQHVALHYHHGQIHVNGTKLDLNRYNKLMVCQKHGDDEEHITVENDQWLKNHYSEKFPDIGVLHEYGAPEGVTQEQGHTLIQMREAERRGYDSSGGQKQAVHSWREHVQSMKYAQCCDE